MINIDDNINNMLSNDNNIYKIPEMILITYDYFIEKISKAIPWQLLSNFEITLIIIMHSFI